ncbi:hypothetical protein ALC53_13477 [Atta colombica]|uniref:Uncharacterized protein n=1 Tax=Atta colombica TaxID=520822 RepID=A0A195AVB0_9HYME|nr:hypothetical protein ALC53_13477 [Atta colombica]
MVTPRVGCKSPRDRSPQSATVRSDTTKNHGAAFRPDIFQLHVNMIGGGRRDAQNSFLPIDQISPRQWTILSQAMQLDCNDLARPHVIAFYIHAMVMSGPLCRTIPHPRYGPSGRESLSPSASVEGSSSSIASAIAYPGMVPRVRPRDRVRGTYQLIFPFAHGRRIDPRTRTGPWT